MVFQPIAFAYDLLRFDHPVRSLCFYAAVLPASLAGALPQAVCAWVAALLLRRSPLARTVRYAPPPRADLRPLELFVVQYLHLALDAAEYFETLLLWQRPAHSLITAAVLAVLWIRPDLLPNGSTAVGLAVGLAVGSAAGLAAGCAAGPTAAPGTLRLSLMVACAAVVGLSLLSGLGPWPGLWALLGWDRVAFAAVVGLEIVYRRYPVLQHRYPPGRLLQLLAAGVCRLASDRLPPLPGYGLLRVLGVCLPVAAPGSTGIRHSRGEYCASPCLWRGP